MVENSEPSVYEESAFCVPLPGMKYGLKDYLNITGRFKRNSTSRSKAANECVTLHQFLRQTQAPAFWCCLAPSFPPVLPESWAWAPSACLVWPSLRVRCDGGQMYREEEKCYPSWICLPQSQQGPGQTDVTTEMKLVAKKRSKLIIDFSKKAQAQASA